MVKNAFSPKSSDASDCEQLLKEKQFFESVVKHYPFAVLVQNTAGICQVCNEQFAALFEVQIADAVGQPITKLFPVRLQPLLTAFDQDVLEEKNKPLSRQLSYLSKTGETVTLCVNKVPMKTGGKISSILTVFEDITARHEQEEQLHHTRTLLQAILDYIPLGIYTRTNSQKMTYFNKQSQIILGRTDPKEVNKAHARQPIATAQQYSLREQEILKEGVLKEYPEEKYIDESGKEHILRVIKVPLFHAGPEPLVLTIIDDITQKHLQDKELKRANAFLSAIIDNVPVGLYARTAVGKLLLHNQQSNEIFHEGLEDMDEYGMGHHETTEQSRGYLNREEELLESGKILDIPEENYVTKDNQNIILHMVKVPVHPSDGQPGFVITMVEDITLRKKQEKELIRAQEFLQKVVDNLPVALSVKRPDGTYIVWNRRSEDIFGVAAKDVLGKTSYRTDIPKEQLDFILESDQRVFDNRRELNIAQELISTPTEGVKIMHTVKTPLYTTEGTPDYLLSVSEDITNKTKMERQIREAGEKNSLLVENTREGIFILEARQIIYCNRAAYRMLGYQSADELIGKRLAEFVAADYRQSASEKYEAVANQLPGAETPVSLFLQKKSGAFFEVELSALASKYLGRRIVIVFIQDITATNKIIRDMRNERETFRQVFELGVQPMFILNQKGYIHMMNRAARELFHFTENDRNFYRNIYIRPALNLHVRRRMLVGQPAQMNYVLDFDWAAKQFPGFVRASGKLPLHFMFIPFNRRDMSNGEVRADYLVTISPIEIVQHRPFVQPSMSAEDPAEKTDLSFSLTEEKTIQQTDGFGDLTKTFIQTLEGIDLPAVVLDLKLDVRYANPIFVSVVGRKLENILGNNFFEDFITNALESCQLFKEKAQGAPGNAFKVQLQTKTADTEKKYSSWDVFVMRDRQSQVEGYGLICTSQN